MPVVAIDGPSGAGKGTVARILAEKLGFSLLDSGALYRIVGYAADQQGIDLSNGDQVASIVPNLQIEFIAGEQEVVGVILDGVDVTTSVRSQRGADMASKVAVHEPVRAALLDLQRAFDKLPGLVADGRDMGTVVFPNASVKVYLTASAEARAERRYKQLKLSGGSGNIARLLEEIKERDERDQNRAVAPLRPAEDSVLIDSTTLSIDEVIDQILPLATSLS